MYETLFYHDFNSPDLVGLDSVHEYGGRVHYNLRGRVPEVGDHVWLVDYDIPDPITLECKVREIKRNWNDTCNLYYLDQVGDYEYGKIPHEDPEDVLETLETLAQEAEENNLQPPYITAADYRKEIEYFKKTYLNWREDE